MENLRSASGPTELSLNGDDNLLKDKLTGFRNIDEIPMLRSALVAGCCDEPPTITRSASEPVSHTEESTTSSG